MSYAAAQEILERSAPDSLDLAATLSIRGSVAQQRGDFGRAEALHRRALALTDRLAPDSNDNALVLNRLGVVTREQGDLDEAEAFHRRALAVFERTTPGGVEVAGCYNNLGLVAAAREDWAAAEAFHLQALAIRERLKPDGPDVAASLTNLGALAADRGDYAAAEGYLRRSLAIKRTTAPGTPDARRHAAQPRRGAARPRAGTTTRGRRSRRRAPCASDWRRAAATWRRTGTRSATSTASRAGRRTRSPSGAARSTSWTRSAGSSPAPTARASSAATRCSTATRKRFLIERGRAAEAFAIHERFHARALLALLAGRGQADASPMTPPLDLEGVRASLDRGAALLAYGVMRRSVVLYVVRAAGDPGPPVTVVTLAFDEDALRARVLAFRGLLERGRDAPALEPALVAQGERLYADLVRPAERALDGAERLLVSPDGPLHLLPFAALVRSRAAAPVRRRMEAGHRDRVGQRVRRDQEVAPRPCRSGAAGRVRGSDAARRPPAAAAQPPGGRPGGGALRRRGRALPGPERHRAAGPGAGAGRALPPLRDARAPRRAVPARLRARPQRRGRGRRPAARLRGARPPAARRGPRHALGVRVRASATRRPRRG